jgi:hypothetical protein
MDTVFLSHLAHDSQLISSEFVPYALACIMSYLFAYSKHPFDARLFVYPRKFARALREVRPSVTAFTNYMWNLDLSYRFAEAVKKEYPDTLVIIGGPNFPLESARQEAWLRERPAVDVHLAGEAE